MATATAERPRKEQLVGRLVAEEVYNSAEPVRLRFELTNSGSEDVYVLRWFTPLEGLNSDCLHVSRDGGKPIEYDGPMVKRGHPGPEDYLLVPAGKTVSVDVDVSESYPVSKPAEYRVELNIPAVQHIPAPAKSGVTTLLAKSTPKTQSLSGGGIRFQVKKGQGELTTRGEAVRADEAKLAKMSGKASSTGAVGIAAGPLPPTFNGGTKQEQKQVLQAQKDGFDLCEAALTALADDTQYEEWFGDHTAARFKKVKAVYTKIRSRMKSTAYTYDLSGTGCKSSYFAYTYKGSTTIWLCGAFWKAPATGTDSKAGTMLHEHSHSDANTDDVAGTYGQAGCRSLAKANPDDAIRNADNYEYYAGG